MYCIFSLLQKCVWFSIRKVCFQSFNSLKLLLKHLFFVSGQLPTLLVHNKKKVCIPIRKRNIFPIWPCKLRRRRYEDKNKHIRLRERARSEKKCCKVILFSLKLVIGYLWLIKEPSKKVSCKLHIILIQNTWNLNIENLVALKMTSNIKSVTTLV